MQPASEYEQIYSREYYELWRHRWPSQLRRDILDQCILRTSPRDREGRVRFSGRNVIRPTFRCGPDPVSPLPNPLGHNTWQVQIRTSHPDENTQPDFPTNHLYTEAHSHLQRC